MHLFSATTTTSLSSAVQGAALSPYYAGANYYGPGSDYGPSSYFPKTGPGIGKAVGAQDYAKAYDLGSSNQLQNRGDYNLQDYSLNGLNKNLWANDQFQSADNSQSASSRDQGRSGVIRYYSLKFCLAGIACWLKRRTRDRKVASSNPGRSGRRIFFSRVNFVCLHSDSVSVPPPSPSPHVAAVARKRPRSFCQK